MDSSWIQRVATLSAAVVAVTSPVLFSFLGNRSNRRRAAEMEVIAKLTELRPKLGNDRIRSKIDFLAADYVEDIEIGLRSSSRTSLRLNFMMLGAWFGGLVLQVLASWVTKPELGRVSHTFGEVRGSLVG